MGKAYGSRTRSRRFSIICRSRSSRATPMSKKVRGRSRAKRSDDDLRAALSALDLDGLDADDEPDGKLSRPDTKSGRLQRACLELLREHERNGELPTNGRFIFYEAEQRGVVPKHYDNLVHQPAHDITLALIHLRQHGLIPWHWLTDESR